MSTTIPNRGSLLHRMARRKPIGRAHDTELKRTIGLFQLTMFGVGATIGTGIFFVLTTEVPAAGPAVVFSFVIAAFVAGLTALCYAELAGAVPVSGSSYSYAYATLGEAVAMAIAACLLLEYGVSSAAVAVGWSQYLNELLNNVAGFRVPHILSVAPSEGGLINLPAMVLVFLCMLLLIRGASESATANAIMVLIKIGVLAMFVVIAFTGWNSNNLADFAPFGFAGVWAASAGIFFSFIGLDAVSTAGEEVKDPGRTMPRAIVLALIIVTTVYVLVALAAVAAQPWQRFEGQEAGLAQILLEVTGSSLPATIVAAGAVISIFSVTLVTMYGQTRILFTMGSDGVLPPIFKRVNPKTLTPIPNTIIVAVVVSLLAGLVPLEGLADLVSIGTLAAFTVVAIAVILLRRREPDLPRTFRVPGYPVTPVLSIIACLFVISGLHWVTFLFFGLWVGAMMLFYFVYGIKHSNLEPYPNAEES
ncbi:amino acid transporter [Kineosphaera limosa]|uniref:Putative amino acid transporter n=1 Tax=Kineosphaera limosa NBRC 100340 TaxID=1184609 RepID=K6XGR4_9MICO|nr:amino acid permease [Kineosphaera limosa]NYE00256.1 amino acid transporter [Kineosphaera limosa]GAB98034.1 putative amino acid transporter [Kineosphaera limosa NBRC 100340]